MTVYLSGHGFQGFNVSSVCVHCNQRIYGYWIHAEYSWIHPHKSIRRYEARGIDFHTGAPTPIPAGRVPLLTRRVMAYLRSREGIHRDSGR